MLITPSPGGSAEIPMGASVRVLRSEGDPGAELPHKSPTGTWGEMGAGGRVFISHSG